MKKKIDVFDAIASGSFILSIFFVIFIFYYFGNSLNATNYNSTLLVMSNSIKGEDSVHFSVSAKKGEKLDFDGCNTLCHKLARYKDELHPYCKINNNLEFTYNSYNKSIGLCCFPVYSDHDFTEYLNLPLYDPNSPIKKGPATGADYASYIPSSMADELLVELGLSTYEELIQEKIVYDVRYLTYECKMSISNVYLSGETDNWREQEITDFYYEDFAKWNPNAIITYAPKFFKETNNVSPRFDFSPSYRYIDMVLKDSKKYLSQTEIECTVSRSNKNDLNYSINLNDSVVKLTDKVQIISYISFSVLLVSQIVFLFSFNHIKYHLVKHLFIVTGAFVVFLLVGEIIKTVSSTVVSPFLIFNSIGTIASIVYLLLLYTAGVLLEKDNKNEGKNNK